MNMQELVQGLTYLGTAYGKTYTQTECEIHFDFLRDYNFNTFVKAVKDIIRRSRYLPRINELIEECEKAKFEERAETIKGLDLPNKTKTLILAGYIPEHVKDEYEAAYRAKELKRIGGAK